MPVPHDGNSTVDRSGPSDGTFSTQRYERHAQRVLHDVGGPMDVSELARAVASLEDSASREGSLDERTRSVHLALHHLHLPKLHEAGALEFDHNAGRVSLAKGNR